MLMNGDSLLRQQAPNWWWKTRKSWLMGRLRLHVTVGSCSGISSHSVSHLENYWTESTCSTWLASQSPPCALECGQIQWNSQWTDLRDRNTHSFNSVCIYIHFASQNKILSKHLFIKHLGYGCVGWNTPEYTTKQKQSKTHRHKKHETSFSPEHVSHELSDRSDGQDDHARSTGGR